MELKIRDVESRIAEIRYKLEVIESLLKDAEIKIGELKEVVGKIIYSMVEIMKENEEEAIKFLKEVKGIKND
jgi:hypothetical protein